MPAVGLAGALLGAAAVLTANWTDRVPANAHDAPAFGALPTAQSGAGRVFRLVTWNVHRFEGTDGRTDIERCADTLANTGFDVAALQEAPGSGGSDPSVGPLTELAKETESAAAFIGTERRFGGAHIGNALLARLPTGQVHRLPLPDTRGKAFRTSVLTTVTLPDGTPVRVMNVHLANTADGEAQTARVVDLFLSLRAPCVLAGDFNQTIDSPELKPLLAAEGVTDALVALPSRDRNIDHIFVRGLTASGAAIVRTEASDHPLYRVDLSLPGPSGGDRISPTRERQPSAQPAD